MKKILLTSLFILTLFVGGVTVHAMGASPSDVPFSNLRYQPTLRMGSYGQNVSELQKALKNFGYYTKAIDGKFGPGTYAAVRRFQMAKGLKADGIVGSKTFAKILEGDTRKIYQDKKIKDHEILCTQEYAPVCGEILSEHINGKSTFKTFPNMCTLQQAGEEVRFAYKGECKTIKPVNIDFDMPKIATLSVDATSREAHGNIRDMGDADELKTFFIVGVDRYHDYIQNLPQNEDSFDDVDTHGVNLMKTRAGNFSRRHTFSKEFYFQNGVHYWVNACAEFEDDNENEYLVCGGAKEFILPENSGTQDCLQVTPNGSNPVVVVGQHQRQVGEFAIENVCRKTVRLDEVDLKVASSFAKFQIEHVKIGLGSQIVADGILQRNYNNSIGGYDLQINADLHGFELDAGDDVDLYVNADIKGVYAPWQFSQHSTAFAVSFDDIDYRYGNQTYGWNKRPVWDNLIVVNYSN